MATIRSPLQTVHESVPTDVIKSQNKSYKVRVSFISILMIFYTRNMCARYAPYLSVCAV